MSEKAIYPALQFIDADIGSVKNTDLAVLGEVNWRVAVGDYWVIGGLQATGKSDLLATAAGLMPPLRGTCLVFGEDPTGTSELARGIHRGSPFERERESLLARLRVGMVFDGGRLLNHLTVAENVSLPLRYHERGTLAEALSRTEALLKFVGLEQQAESLPGSLAWSWQQRVGLARALALNPEILLVDGVTTGVDTREVTWWLDTLDKLAAGHEVLDNKAVTIVVATGNLRPFRNRARQFGVLSERRFIPVDAPLDTALAANAHLRELFGNRE
jgi:ABC-type polar amino acid transport system ATPase subunit